MGDQQNSDDAPLSWGLVVATYHREKILPVCLRLAAEQTRKPVEIIIVDASENWQATRDKAQEKLFDRHPEINWTYVGAQRKGLTAQRNEGLSHATADVVFLLDDDSLMYPRCAAEVLRVYEADTQGVVQGVQLVPADDPPSGVVVADAQKVKGSSGFSRVGNGAVTWVKELLWKHLFFMSAEQIFVPYDGSFPNHELPAAVRKLRVRPTRLFQGFRMTFRRDVIAKERFESLFSCYPYEDLDASYRVSRHGVLLAAIDARVHHFESAAARPARFKLSAFSALNHALCLKKHAKHLGRAERSFRRLMRRRLAAECFKDVLSRRFSLPQARGLSAGTRCARQLFASPCSELAENYKNLERQLLKRSEM